jgi:hypothetical protein
MRCHQFLDGMDEIELDEMAHEVSIPSLCKIGSIGIVIVS